MNKTEEKALTRNKMIEAAIVEFGLHGYEGASTNQICAGASISKGLLYHYFKSKENLFEETLRYCMEDFHRAEQDACCREAGGHRLSGGCIWAAHRFFCRAPLPLSADRPVRDQRGLIAKQPSAAALSGGNLAIWA